MWNISYFWLLSPTFEDYSLPENTLLTHIDVFNKQDNIDVIIVGHFVKKSSAKQPLVISYLAKN